MSLCKAAFHFEYFSLLLFWLCPDCVLTTKPSLGYSMLGMLGIRKYLPAFFIFPSLVITQKPFLTTEPEPRILGTTDMFRNRLCLLIDARNTRGMFVHVQHSRIKPSQGWRLLLLLSDMSPGCTKPWQK